jgi:phosphohistidine phosphatase
LNIYLIRHSDAVDTSKDVTEDEYRYLSEKGRIKTSEVAHKLDMVGIKFDMVLASPYVRAVQTAEIMVSILKYSGEIRSVSELLNGTPFSKFQNLILKYSQYDNIACFGHNPDLTMYVRNFLQPISILPLYEMKKSSVCTIEYNTLNGESKLIWILDPDEMKIISPAKNL